MKFFTSVLLFAALFSSSAYAVSDTKEYFLMGKGTAAAGGINSVTNPHPEKPIYRIYVRNKGPRTATIGFSQIFSGPNVFKINFGVSAYPDYGVFLVVDRELPTLVDKVEFELRSPAADATYEVYGITVPNFEL